MDEADLRSPLERLLSRLSVTGEAGTITEQQRDIILRLIDTIDPMELDNVLELVLESLEELEEKKAWIEYFHNHRN